MEPPIYSVQVLLTTLAAIGLAGGLAALWGLRLRHRWFLWIGAALCGIGYGLFALIVWEIVPPELVNRLANSVLPVPLVKSGTISSEDEAMLLDLAEHGALSPSDFGTLITMSVPSRSVGSRGGAVITQVAERLKQGRLGGPYSDQLVDALVASWPVWAATGGEIDPVPEALLASRALSPAARSRLIAFMLAQHANTTKPLAHGWTRALDLEVLSGRMSVQQLQTYLTNVAQVELRVGQFAGPQRPGNVAECIADLADDRGLNDQRGSLPWRAYARLRDGDGVVGRTDELPTYPGRPPPVIGHVLVPATPGEYSVTADVTVWLTHDLLRDYFAWNPDHRPAGMAIEHAMEGTVTFPVTLSYQVGGERGPRPERVGTPGAQSQVAAAVQAARWNVSFRDGGMTGTQVVRFSALPVSLAMDAVWVVGDREIMLGWFLAREGEEPRIECTVPIAIRDCVPSKLILRPNLSLIDAPEGVTRIYDGPAIELPPRR